MALPQADTNACGRSLRQAAVTDNGALYTWGHGGYGQLGHDTRDNTQVPRLVTALAGIRVLMASVRHDDVGLWRLTSYRMPHALGFRFKLRV